MGTSSDPAAVASERPARRKPLIVRKREIAKKARDAWQKKKQARISAAEIGGSERSTRKRPLITRKREIAKKAREAMQRRKQADSAAELTDLRAANTTLSAENAQLRDEKRTLGNENAELRMEVEQLRRQSSAAEIVHRNRTLLLRYRNAELSAQRDLAVHETSILRSRLRALEREVRELERENAPVVPQEGDTFIIDPSERLTTPEILQEVYNFKTLLDALRLPAGTYATVKWLAQRGLIPNNRSCEECRSSYRIIIRAQVTDGVSWYCSSCRKFKSIREGSFFFRSKFALWQLVLLMYGFAEDLAEHTIAAEAHVDGTHSIVDSCNFCREVCSEWVTRNRRPIGGLTETFDDVIDVEVDESYFFHRKYNRGRRFDGVWVVGGVERATGKCFLRIVDNRNRPTLEAVIQEEILPGSHIITDAWPAYNTVATLNGGVYSHDVVNHTTGFTHPQLVGVHTNTIEGLWQHAKAKLRRGHGTSPELFPKYLDEFMWRRNSSGGSAFTRFMVAVAEQYCV